MKTKIKVVLMTAVIGVGGNTNGGSSRKPAKLHIPCV